MQAVRLLQVPITAGPHEASLQHHGVFSHSIGGLPAAFGYHRLVSHLADPDQASDCTTRASSVSSIYKDSDPTITRVR